MEIRDYLQPVFILDKENGNADISYKLKNILTNIDPDEAEVIRQLVNNLMNDIWWLLSKLTVEQQREYEVMINSEYRNY